MRRFGPGLLLIALSAAALSGCGGGDDESAPASGTAQTPRSHSADRFEQSRADDLRHCAAGRECSEPVQLRADVRPTPTATRSRSVFRTSRHGRRSTRARAGSPARPPPADVGTYSNISISVSDGQASTALSAVRDRSDDSLERPRHAVVDRADREHGRQLAVEPRRLSHPLRHERVLADEHIVINNVSVTTYVVEDLAPCDLVSSRSLP